MSDTPAPVFDFENVSRKWEKQWRKVNVDLTATAQLIEADSTGADDKIMAVRSIDDIDAIREKLLSQIVVSIPREWLVKDAPKDIDWSDVASFDWLKMGKFNDLVASVSAERSPKN
jgi:hypothetical protein